MSLLTWGQERNNLQTPYMSQETYIRGSPPLESFAGFRGGPFRCELSGTSMRQRFENRTYEIWARVGLTSEAPFLQGASRIGWATPVRALAELAWLSCLY